MTIEEYAIDLTKRVAHAIRTYPAEVLPLAHRVEES